MNIADAVLINTNTVGVLSVSHSGYERGEVEAKVREKISKFSEGRMYFGEDGLAAQIDYTGDPRNIGCLFVAYLENFGWSVEKLPDAKIVRLHI